ncbi:MAG: 30S ribosomal protein S5 [Candidatus Vogelbacteria bacterium CG10_big_fil_rev_8_21_14_0_10_49_38]|uniref:Small ribosomal subunit protein uS5 n=1 Tax=Candidatus Vogelbacteria bacterium CG10_big_fil_rev_8_21_14_0_10_49_38 TaxID=1975043 RepID=A0A2H0RK88_9BACT|nr:MAG: 30S ribosomal protein S5 [Candidatus Vogelbacteria bacterium CG10_big_fil_rev_8_21_14_0_10_49_38]
MAPTSTARPSFSRGAGAPRRQGGAGGSRRGAPAGRGRRSTFERPKPEFDHKTIKVRRVARVVSGGRRFSFSVALVAGDRNGRVSVGVGKAGDTALAIEKALNQAKRAMIRVNLTDKKSIAHETFAKFKAAQVTLRPAAGRGLVAGSATRVVLSLAGIHDVNAKVVSRSKDKLNIARATVLALSDLQTRTKKPPVETK